MSSFGSLSTGSSRMQAPQARQGRRNLRCCAGLGAKKVMYTDSAVQAPLVSGGVGESERLVKGGPVEGV